MAFIAINIKDGFAILNLVPFGSRVDALLILFILKGIPPPSDNHGVAGIGMTGLQANLEGIVDLEEQQAVGQAVLIGEVRIVCLKGFVTVE